jgi:hypothetical protein
LDGSAGKSALRRWTWFGSKAATARKRVYATPPGSPLLDYFAEFSGMFLKLIEIRMQRTKM